MHGINGSQQGSKGCTQGEAEFHPPNRLHPGALKKNTTNSQGDFRWFQPSQKKKVELFVEQKLALPEIKTDIAPEN